MYNIFYSNISEFGGNLEGMIDEGMYRINKYAKYWLEGKLLQAR